MPLFKDCETKKLINSLIFFLCASFAYARDDGLPGNEPEPPAIGNFGVPFSQQIGPLVSFGQNMIGKGITQAFLFADDYAGVKQHFVDAIPGVVYGIRDDLSVFLNVPFAVSYQEDHEHSSGISDAFVQLEYAYYTKSDIRSYTQGTIVTSVSAPTGSTKKQPETGYGAPTFFLGTTWSKMYTDWYYFTSYGGNFPTTHNSEQFGNEYFYQGGVGRNITTTKSWLFAWIVEADGQYTEKTKIHGIHDPNSGGNIVYITPSIWASSKHAILQFGVGLPATQHWYGNQKRQNYLVLANLGWTF